MGIDLGDLLGGVLNAVEGFDPIKMVVDEGCKLLGLPPEVKDAVELGAGCLTGDVCMAAQAGGNLIGDVTSQAGNSQADTAYVPPSSDPAAGYIQNASGWGPPEPFDLSDPDVLNFMPSDPTQAAMWADIRSKCATNGVIDNAKLETALKNEIVDNAEFRREFEQRFGVKVDVAGSEGVGPLFVQRHQDQVPPPPMSGTTDGGSDDISSILNDPNMSVDDKVDAILAALDDKIDKDITKTMGDIDKAQKSGQSSNGSNQELADLQQKLQRLVERRQQMEAMRSNISKDFHDMEMSIINNMRG